MVRTKNRGRASGAAASAAAAGSRGPRHPSRPASAAAQPQKPRRVRPGTRALQNIRKYQRSTNLLLQKLPFARVVRHSWDATVHARWLHHSHIWCSNLFQNVICWSQVREVCDDFTNRSFRWQADALLALQEAAEAYLVGLFEDS